MRLGFRELIFLFVLLAMPLSSYWFVFRPQNVEIAQARAEIEHKERMLEKLAQATARNDDLERANKEIADGIAMVESRLGLPKVRSGRPIPASKYMEQPLDMTITGDFDDFYSFMLQLEEMARITRMPDLKVKKMDDVDGNMEASFTLSIYFEPDSAGGAR